MHHALRRNPPPQACWRADWGSLFRRPGTEGKKTSNLPRPGAGIQRFISGVNSVEGAFCSSVYSPILSYGSSAGKIAFGHTDNGNSDVDPHIAGQVFHPGEVFHPVSWGCKDAGCIVTRRRIIHRIPVFKRSQSLVFGRAERVPHTPLQSWRDWSGTQPSSGRISLANGICYGEDGDQCYKRGFGHVPTTEGGGRCTLCSNPELRCESRPSYSKVIVLMVRVPAVRE